MNDSSRNKKFIGALALALVFILSGCGGDNPPPLRRGSNGSGGVGGGSCWTSTNGGFANNGNSNLSFQGTVTVRGQYIQAGSPWGGGGSTLNVGGGGANNLVSNGNIIYYGQNSWSGDQVQMTAQASGNTNNGGGFFNYNGQATVNGIIRLGSQTLDRILTIGGLNMPIWNDPWNPNQQNITRSVCVQSVSFVDMFIESESLTAGYMMGNMYLNLSNNGGTNSLLGGPVDVLLGAPNNMGSSGLWY